MADIPNLLFTPTLNLNGPGAASFTFQVVDDGATGGGNVNTDQSPNTLTFAVTALNDAPAGADVRTAGDLGKHISPSRKPFKRAIYEVLAVSFAEFAGG